MKYPKNADLAKVHENGILKSDFHVEEDFWRLKLFPNLAHKCEKQPPEVFFKKIFFNILQNSQGNTCVWVFFLIKLRNF